MLPPDPSEESIAAYRRREAVRLRTQEGRTNGEIAERLGISRERVKQLVRGRPKGEPPGQMVLFGHRGDRGEGMR